MPHVACMQQCVSEILQSGLNLFNLLVLWAMQLLSHWILYYWRVKDCINRELFYIHPPTSSKMPGMP